MTSTLAFNLFELDYTNAEGVMPLNTHGRFVYVYVMSDALQVIELEVFPPFSFGEYKYNFLSSDMHMTRAPSQYKDRLIYVWRFPC